MLGGAAVTCLILHIAVTQLQTQQVLVRLAQGLVEVEMRQFHLSAQQRGHHIVDTVDRLLGDAVVTVTRRLQGRKQQREDEILIGRWWAAYLVMRCL